MASAKMIKEAIEGGAKYSKTSALWGTVKDAAKNIGGVNWRDAEYVPAAIKGALWGAGIEGTTEWAQGGSFWAGARSGAFTGAMVGAGYRAAKVGAFGGKFAVGKEKSVRGFGDTAARYQGMYRDNVSKQVLTIQRKEAVENIAKKEVINNTKARKYQQVNRRGR